MHMQLGHRHRHSPRPPCGGQGQERFNKVEELLDEVLEEESTFTSTLRVHQLGVLGDRRTARERLDVRQILL